MNITEQQFGYSALERIAEAPRFNEWMYNTIRPYLLGDILEVGCGIGNISSYVIKDKKSITLSDYDANYISLLKIRFGGSPYVKNIIELDLARTAFKKELAPFAGSFDTIYLLNVLEHIEDDITAVNNLYYLLKPGGRLIVLVPSYRCLYSDMDRLLGHYRRYTISSLTQVIQKNKLHVIKAFHFNLLGMAGWYWNKIFKQAEISQEKMNLFNKLVPVGKLLDKLFLNKVGLSTIIVAGKPTNE